MCIKDIICHYSSQKMELANNISIYIHKNCIKCMIIVFHNSNVQF